MDNEQMITIIAAAVKNDINNGVGKDALFRTLSQIVGTEICGKIKERI